MLGQMQTQGTGFGTKTQTCTFHRFAVEIQVQALQRFHLQPGQPCADRNALQAKNAPGQQRAQGADDILRRRHDADIEQTIVDARLRTKQMPATGLSPVTDAKSQKLALPLEIRPMKTTGCRAHFGKAAEPGKQIGGATQDFLEFL